MIAHQHYGRALLQSINGFQDIISHGTAACLTALISGVSALISDEFINGKEDALNEKEQKGLVSFVDNGCIQCHNGALFGGTSFQKFGVYKPYWKATGSEKHDEGRFEVTQKESDKYMFKVPSLRNVEKTAPYFHDGSVETLAETIKIMADIQLNKQLSIVQTFCGEEEVALRKRRCLSHPTTQGK